MSEPTNHDRSDELDETVDFALSQETEPRIDVPGYRVERLIRKSGQAMVFVAIQESSGQRVAVKVMREGPFATDQQVARFEREIRVLTSLDHPSIVNFIDRGKTADGSYFFVMNFISGLPLGEFLEQYRKRHGDPPEDTGQLLMLFLKVAQALNSAHLRGIVHRDLKPSNIMVDQSGEPHLLDFGLARTPFGEPLDGDPMGALTITGQFVGSLPWASPEQAEGIPSKIDTRTDVYALGVIFYQMLTGEFPYVVVGNMRDVLNNILSAEPTPPSQVIAAKRARAAQRNRRPRPPGRKAINEGLEAIILKSLAKSREDRYQNAGELARDLKRYLTGQPTQAASDRRVVRRVADRPGRRQVVIGFLVLLGVSSLAGTIYWSLGSSGKGRNETARKNGESSNDSSGKPDIVPTFSALQLENAQMKSRTNLKALAIAMTLYSTAFRERYPPNFATFLQGEYTDPRVLVSPLDGTKIPGVYLTWPKPKRNEWAIEHCSYVILCFGKRALGRYDQVIAFERFADDKGGTAVAFEDGSVNWMELGDARTLIEKQTGKTIEELQAKDS